MTRPQPDPRVCRQAPPSWCPRASRTARTGRYAGRVSRHAQVAACAAADRVHTACVAALVGPPTPVSLVLQFGEQVLVIKHVRRWPAQPGPSAVHVGATRRGQRVGFARRARSVCCVRSWWVHASSVRSGARSVRSAGCGRARSTWPARRSVALRPGGDSDHQPQVRAEDLDQAPQHVASERAHGCLQAGRVGLTDQRVVRPRTRDRRVAQATLRRLQATGLRMQGQQYRGCLPRLSCCSASVGRHGHGPGRCAPPTPTRHLGTLPQKMDRLVARRRREPVWKPYRITQDGGYSASSRQREVLPGSIRMCAVLAFSWAIRGHKAATHATLGPTPRL